MGNHSVAPSAAASIPDLREIGLDLAAAGAYTWQVAHLPLYASADEAPTRRQRAPTAC